MAELATFLPSTTPPSSGGGGSFNTINLTVPVAATIGEAIFVDQAGAYYTESQLKAYNLVISTNQNNWPPRIAHSMSSLNDGLGGNSILPLDPDSFFSIAPVGQSQTINNEPQSGGAFYSVRLGSGFWVILGLGNRGGISSRPAQGWAAYMVASVLSSDGSQVLSNNSFSLGNIMASQEADETSVNVRILAAYAFTDSVRLITLSRNVSTGQYYAASVIITRNTSTNVLTIGSTSLPSILWGQSNGTTTLQAVCVNPVFIYNTVPYYIALTSSNQVTLVNLNNNAITNISIPGVTRWNVSETDLARAVIAGTALHIYNGNTGVPPTVINLTNMTSPSSGLPAGLTASRYVTGNIIKLDATTYAYPDGISNTWVTVRHSADGITTATVTTSGTAPWGLAFAANIGGTLVLMRGGNHVTYYSGNNTSVIGTLSYNSVAGTSSVVAATSTQETLAGLLNRMAVRVGDRTPSIDVLNIRYILPVALDMGRETNNTGTLLYQSFSPRHYTRYVPTYIGRATTAGTSITVLLHGTVQKYAGAVAGVLYSGEVIGLPSEYAVRLTSSTWSGRPQTVTISGIESGTSFTETSNTIGRFLDIDGALGQASLTSIGSYLITTDRYTPNRCLVGEAVSGVTATGGKVAALYVTNGRFIQHWTWTSSSNSQVGSKNSCRMRWEPCPWSTLIGLTSLSMSGSNSMSSAAITGVYREYEI